MRGIGHVRSAGAWACMHDGWMRPLPPQAGGPPKGVALVAAEGKGKGKGKRAGGAASSKAKPAKKAKKG